MKRTDDDDDVVPSQLRSVNYSHSAVWGNASSEDFTAAADFIFSVKAVIWRSQMSANLKWSS